MLQWVSILLGGGLGALLRFLLSNGIYQLFGKAFPYGTLFVNVLGSFLIGLLTFLFMQRGLLETPLARGLIVGVLGALTTFSTFSLDNFDLLMQGAILKCVVNMVLNVGFCLLAVSLGVLVARSF
ncbi:MAG: fluoride efflux transporter CrcB [Proteobacteria bacterium]|nr:MAG: fluoride efflux transporter CrcB [Pseudomonadota bacterium]